MNICIICYANYCRSPVAEQILQNRYPNNNFSSAGIKPIYKADMDTRSKNFLNSIGITPKLHTPKGVNTLILKKSDLALVMDLMLLMELNKKFPKYKNKIKLFTFQSPDKRIVDPYSFDLDNYNRVMSDIESVCDSLNF